MLSSGFLAFARHAGFLAAVEERALRVEAMCGTSSGAVAAALWSAGRTSSEIVELFAGRSFMGMARPSAMPWRGMLTLDAFIAFLRLHLPARFEDLRMPLAVGVVDGKGNHQLISSGPLVEAVAASCAMPDIFAPVNVEGRMFVDGGAKDRLALDAHRGWRPGTRIVAHWVERTAGRDVHTALDAVTVVRTPRSGAQFWNLGDVGAQAEQARALTLRALRELLDT